MKIDDLIHEDHLDIYKHLSEDDHFHGVMSVIVNEAEPLGVAQEAVNLYLDMLEEIDPYRVDFIDYAEMVIAGLPDLARVLRKR